MKKFPTPPPSDEQIAQLFLDSSVSGRLSPSGLDMLVHYIRALRDKGVQHKHYISPETKPANDTDTPEALGQI